MRPIFSIPTLLYLFISSAWAANTAIPFRLVNNLIIIEANIEATTGFLILDTGSDGFFLDEKLSEGRGKSASFSTLNGECQADIFKIKTLTVGGISKKNLEAFHANLSHLESFLSIDLAGIIGVDLFNPHSLYIDYQNKLIYFYKKEPDYSLEKNNREVDFFLVGNIPVVNINIDNKVYHFIFDSGASIHVVDQTLINSHFQKFWQTEEPVSFMTLENTKAPETFYYKMKEIMLGSTVIQETKCLVKDFSELQIDTKFPIHGIISMSKLNQTGIVIDFQKMKIYY